MCTATPEELDWSWKRKWFKKKKISLLPPALSLKEVRFLWRTSRGAGCEQTPTFLILMSRHLQGQYALRKESAYMSCTYTKISLTQQDIWFLFWRSWVWLKGWLTSVCTGWANRFKCFDVLRWCWFLHQSYCSELDGVFFLMYINQGCQSSPVNCD